MPASQRPALGPSDAKLLASLTAWPSDVTYMLRLEPDLAVEFVSPSVQALVGFTPEELYADPRVALRRVDPVDRDAAERAVRSSEVGEVVDFTVGWVARDGAAVWTSHRCSKHQRGDGAVVLCGAARDVTDRVRLEQALGAERQRLRLLLDDVTEVVFRGDRDAVIQWVSPSVTGALGWLLADLVGHAVTEFVHPEDLPSMESASELVNTGVRGDYEARLRAADGGYRWMAVVVRPVKNDHGEVIGGRGSARDIQGEVDVRQALARSEQRFRLAMQSAPVGMAVADLDRRFLAVNPALCRMLDRDEAWLLTHRVPDVLEASFDELDLRMRAQVVSGRSESATREQCLVARDGSSVWAQHSIGLVRDDYGLPQSYVCQFVDITQAKEAREKLSYLADHDPLTGLLTRTALMAEVQRIGSHPPRRGTRLGVLFLDVDRFKEINDRHGHAAGDQVLIQVAERTGGSARGDDLVARLGGDEVLVALPTIHAAADAEAVASKIHTALAEPLLVHGVPMHATVSIGIAVAEPDEDVEHVIARADQALYRAKRTGRDRTVTHDPGLDTAQTTQASD